MSSAKEVQSGLREEKERSGGGGGGQARLILKGFLPPAAPVFLSEHLFFLNPPVPFSHLSIFLRLYKLAVLSHSFPPSLHHSLSPHPWPAAVPRGPL